MFFYFEDNLGIIVNNKGKMKGFVIIGLIVKECIDVWFRIILNVGSIV